MKLIKNKDLKCLKCNVFICCENEGLTRIFNHHFCWNCGESIEWVTERSAEEVLEELIKEAIRYGSIGRGIQENNIDSLKQELLNKINN